MNSFGRGDDKKEKNRASVMTRETVGMTILLFSVIIFFIAATGKYVFGDPGAAITAFFLGLFGIMFYPLDLLFIYLGCVMVFGKKLIPAKWIVRAGLFALSVFFIVHLATAERFVSAGYGGYLSGCWSAAANGAGGSTGGGVVLGVIAFPVRYLLSAPGAYVFAALLTALSVFFILMGTPLKKYVSFRKKGGAPAEAAEKAPVTFGELSDPVPAPRVAEQSAPAAEAFEDPRRPVPAQQGRSERETSRDILFRGDPSASYRNNLIFDSDSQFNSSPRRSSIEGERSRAAESSAPTYTERPYDASRSASGAPATYAERYSGQAESSRPPMPRKIVPAERTYAPREDDVSYPQTPPTYRAPAAPAEGVRDYYSHDVPAEDSVPSRPSVRPSYRAPDPAPARETPASYREEPAEEIRRTEPVEDAAPVGEDNARDLFRSAFSRPLPADEKKGESRFGFGSRATEESEDTARIERAFHELDNARRGYEPPKEEPAVSANRFEEEKDEPAMPSRNRFEEEKDEPITPSRNRFGEAKDEPATPSRNRFEEGKDEPITPSRNRFEEVKDEPITPSRGRFGEVKDEPITPSRGRFGETEDRTPVRGSAAGLFDEDDDFDDADYETDDGIAAPSRSFEGLRAAPERGRERQVSEPVHAISGDPAPVPEKHVYKAYVRPSYSLLESYNDAVTVSEEETERNSGIIVDTLAGFHIDAEVKKVTCGSAVTRYDIDVPGNVMVRAVIKRDEEIAMRLHARDGVNIYSNSEVGAISVEVPNQVRATVGLRSVMEADEYVNGKPSALMFAIGKNVEGRNVCGNIVKMKHILVAGSTGSGKSVCLNAMLISLICKYSPEDLRLILIDPKKVEFAIFDGLPHLMINEIIADAQKAVAALNWSIKEMERRYSLFEQKTRSGINVHNVDEYNANLVGEEEKLPKIVIVVDELADLMSVAKKDIEDRIQRLAQKARAAGMHLVIATQRPSVDVITGVIKGNLPTRLAFRVIQEVDSRTILDESGAEKLLGNGDMLYRTEGMFNCQRVQGAFISSQEVQAIIEAIKSNNEAYFDESVANYINKSEETSGGGDGGEGDDNVSPLYIKALAIVVKAGTASISQLQRKLSVGYNHAGKMIEWMEMMHYISPFEGKAKPRTVLLTKEDFESKFGKLE